MGVGRKDVYDIIIMSENNNDCKTPFAHFSSNIISIAFVYNTIHHTDWVLGVYLLY